MWKQSPRALWRWMPHWALAASPREESLRFMVPNPPARPRWPCTFWQKPKSGAARLLSWMQSMRWIRFMRQLWVWIPTIFWSPSRTPASRLWRSRMPWFAAAPLMLLLWTLWQPLCPSRKLRAKWAILSWVSRRGLCLRLFGSWPATLPKPTVSLSSSTSCV